jgi:hypothetical protein
MKVSELFEAKGYEPNFKLLDASPSKPLTHAEVMVAMAELHDRVHRQAEHYGGKIDRKTGKIDNKSSIFYHAQIAHP